MNFSITQVTTTTTNTNICKTVTTSAPASVSISNVSDSARKNISVAPFRIENTCRTSLSNNIQNLINPKSFTTPQNCFQILTSIQSNTDSACGTVENCSSQSTTLVPPTFTVATSNVKKEPLEVFEEIKSKKNLNSYIQMDGNSECIGEIENICFDFERKIILPQELAKRESISENCSIYNSDSGTASYTKSYNLATEVVDLNGSKESVKVQTEENSCSNTVDNFELQEESNPLFLNERKPSIESANILHCDEVSLNKSSEISGDLLRSINSSDCIDRGKHGSRLSVRAKKKSWYNILYPNYKSRSQDFKKLFREVPHDERLIVDYSCALYRDILIQGRLFISQNYVCFHANILGWETCLIIKWKDVTSITKEKTALVIPNAISICTPKEKFFFSSFTTRNKTFLILFRVWQNTLMNKPMPAQEIWQLVHKYYGDELGLTTDDEDYIDPTLEDQDDRISNLEFLSAIDDSISLSADEDSIEQFNTNNYQAVESSSGNSASHNSSGNNSTADYLNPITMKTIAKEITLNATKPEDGRSSNSQTQQTSADSPSSGIGTTIIASGKAASKEPKSNTTAFDSKLKMSKNNRQREENLNKNAETLPTDISNSSDSEENNIPFVATAECNSTHEGRQLIHTILPINIETLFSMLFSKSKFLLDFHTMRKSTDLVFSDWIANESGQKTRTFNVTVQLAASVGPKTSRVTEFQVMRHCTKPGELYSIDVNNVNAGIPYADSFSVLVHYCLVKTVDDHTMLSVHAQIKYKKSIWGVVKGFIEKNAWAGLDDFYTALLHSLQSETCIPPAKGKGRRPRRGIPAQIRPLEEMTISQTKPETGELCGAFVQNVSTRHPTDSRPVIAAEATLKFRWLSLFVLVVLCFLIIVNVILLLKLWKLEDRIEEDISTRARMPNLSALKQLPNNHEDWIELLRQQEVLHETELKKWHTVLQTAIELLKKTERTLAELMFR